MSSYIIVNTKSPFSNFIAQESIDLSLAFAAFERKVSLLFIGEGVFQLMKNIDAAKNLRKNFSSILSALDVYDIENIFVSKESLKKYNLKVDDLYVPPKVVADDEIKKLIESHEKVLSF